MDPDAIEAAVTPRTKAIIVMHYAGFPCDMARITKIAERHDLRLVEDACHGLLSEYQGQKLGTIGHVGCFSFFSNKNMTTAEGGMVVTGDADLAARVRLLRSHGMTSLSYDRAKGHATGYDVVDVGFNYRLDDIRAAIGLVQLGKMPDDIARRAALRRTYLEALAGIADISVPFAEASNEARSNYIMAVRVTAGGAERRDAVRAALADDGVQTSMHYPPLHRLKTFAEAEVSLPKCEDAGATLVTLPFYKTMDDRHIDHVVGSLRRALQG
jgi:dTDP-4-amino-4,6-dideoxygalactose transaminase